MTGRALILSGLMAGMLAAASSPAHAIPILQLYIEGSTYDSGSETWVFTSTDLATGGVIRLWTVGNVAGPGGKGTIYDVKLSAVYDSVLGPIDFTITPSTTAGHNGFVDPSTPSTPSFIQIVSDGSTPLLGDGSSLPNHGQYGPGRVWQEFLLGDFALTDSSLTDFNGITDTPSPSHSGAQINVYEIGIAPGAGSSGFGTDPFTIHFDLYNHVEGVHKARYVFAPFSHDAEVYDPPPSADVPEPTSALMFCLGGLGFTLIRRRRTAASA